MRHGGRAGAGARGGNEPVRPRASRANQENQREGGEGRSRIEREGTGNSPGFLRGESAGLPPQIGGRRGRGGRKPVRWRGDRGKVSDGRAREVGEERASRRSGGVVVGWLTWPDTGGETERESTGGPAGWFGSGAGHERFGLLGGRMRRTSGPAWFLWLCRFFGREERAKAKHSVAPTPSASQSHDPENRAGGRAAPARGRCSFPARLPRRLLWRSQWVGTVQAAGGGWGG
jgi:hypothetical protein